MLTAPCDFSHIELGYAAPRRCSACARLDLTSSISSGGGKGFAPEDDFHPSYSVSASANPLSTMTGSQYCGADLPHQFRATATWHQVVGDDHADAVSKHPQRGQRAFRGSGDADLEAGVPQNCLANTQLQRIIVDEQNLAQTIHP